MYFKFQIPKDASGKPIKYSPGWSGTMPKCPKNVTVLLYNDKEGFGIAKTDDNFILKEIEVIKDDVALSIIAKTEDEEGVFFGQKLAERWKP